MGCWKTYSDKAKVMIILGVIKDEMCWNCSMWYKNTNY